jgi:uncharacterized damage-inducible protein DinB
MKAAPPFDLTTAASQSLAISNRITIYLLDNLDAQAWRAEPPGGKGRTAAAIFAHIHNVRVMWLKSAAKGSKIPEPLDREKVTVPQARKALAESAAAVEALADAALKSDGRIRGFKPDAAAFIGYLIAHDSHHRGQISQLARQVGFPISQSANFGMWEWGKRWDNPHRDRATRFPHRFQGTGVRGVSGRLSHQRSRAPRTMYSNR